MLILILLLVLWVAFVVVGLLFKALLWLAIIGLAAFALTLAVSAIRYLRTHQD